MLKFDVPRNSMIIKWMNLEEKVVKSYFRPGFFRRKWKSTQKVGISAVRLTADG
jgi:hypothetical protein